MVHTATTPTDSKHIRPLPTLQRSVVGANTDLPHIVCLHERDVTLGNSTDSKHALSSTPPHGNSCGRRTVTGRPQWCLSFRKKSKRSKHTLTDSKHTRQESQSTHGLEAHVCASSTHFLTQSTRQQPCGNFDCACLVCDCLVFDLFCVCHSCGRRTGTGRPPWCTRQPHPLTRSTHGRYQHSNARSLGQTTICHTKCVDMRET
jgi:hypothetical protein